MSKINFGLPLVGLLDVSSAIEGGMTDVRLEGGEHGEGLEVILSYYDNEGVKNGGGVYRLTEPRGRPVLVGWCDVCALCGVCYGEPFCRLQCSSTHDRTSC